MIYIIFQEAVGGRALSIFKEKQPDPLYNIKKRCRLILKELDDCPTLQIRKISARVL
jgi:hypothetical protein